jgi:hypothetical protein
MANAGVAGEGQISAEGIFGSSERRSDEMED